MRSGEPTAAEFVPSFGRVPSESGASPGPEISYVRPFLYTKQLEAIFCKERYGMIEASTKSGKTHGCIIWLAEQAFQAEAGRNFWWVAPVYAQAKIAFKRLRRGLPREIFTSNESELNITICNGATIWFKSADNPDNLYGEDVFAAVVDEASRCKEDAWIALRTTLAATKGPVRIIGNVKGRRNWFFRMARRAQAGEQEMHFSKLTWRDAVAGGILSESEVEDARRQMPEHAFNELFNADASDDEGNPFGIEAIRKLTVPAASVAAPAVWGWDFAKSNDWTVGIALDRSGNVCRVVRFQSPWGITKMRVKAESAGSQCIGDSTGVGDAIVEDLQRMGVALEAFVFTSKSKQQIMEGLAADIQQGKGFFPEGVLAEELRCFEYEYTATGVRYSAPDGLHDDCVCAYALARLLYRRGVGEPFQYSTTGRGDDGEAVFRSKDFLRSGRNVSLVD